MENKQEKIQIPPEVVKTMLSSSYMLVRSLIETRTPFSISLVNHNNWSAPLPDFILKDHKDHILLSISGVIFDHINIDDEGNIDLSLMFGDDLYHKHLYRDEILGIFDSNGLPFMLNSISDISKLPEYDDYILDSDLWGTGDEFSYFSKNEEHIDIYDWSGANNDAYKEYKQLKGKDFLDHIPVYNKELLRDLNLAHIKWIGSKSNSGFKVN